MITRILYTHGGIVARAQRASEHEEQDRCLVARHVERKEVSAFAVTASGRLIKRVQVMGDVIEIGALDFALATRNKRPLSVKAEKRGGMVFKDAVFIDEVDALRLHEFDQEIDALIEKRRALMLDAMNGSRALSALDLIEGPKSEEQKASEQ